jgi:nitrate reductase delta subunit
MRRGARSHAEHATIYKLCSLALQYPDEELLAARAELAAAADALPRSAAACRKKGESCPTTCR